jgi:transglutaminase-like putative cysteine protease
MRLAAVVLVLSLIPARAQGASWLRLTLGPASTRLAQLPLDESRAAAMRSEGHGFVDLLARYELALRDGRVEETSTQVRRFLTDEGVRAGGNLTFTVSTAWQSAEVLEAWVMLPGGERVTVDRATVQVTTPAQADLFSDARQVTLPLAALMPGATAVLVVRTVEDRRRLPLGWARHFFTQALVPLEHFELRARFGAEQARLSWASDDPALGCRERGGELRCERRGIPAARLEPQMASWLDALPQLVLAERQSWEELAGTERRLVDGAAAAGSPALVELARKLMKAVKAGQRFEALHRFVADRIRYVGIEHGRGALVPRPAAVTLRRGFGDCKDKVTLLVALARRMGIRAMPVLVASGRRDTGKLLLPSPRYFDHMIACASVDGDTICVDPTVPGLPTGEIPLGVRGSVALSLGLSDPPWPPQTFTLTGREPAFIVEADTTFRLGCDGQVEETTRRRFSGAGGAALRAQLAAMTAAERTRDLEESYARVMGTGRSPRIEVLGLEEPAAVVEVRSKAQLAGRNQLVRAPEIREPDGWLVEYTQRFRSSNRVQPYRHEGLRLVSRVTFELCPEMALRFEGPTLRFAGELGSFTRRYTHEPRRVTAETRVELPAADVAPGDQSRFNHFIETALAETNVWFAQAPSTEAARP